MLLSTSRSKYILFVPSRLVAFCLFLSKIVFSLLICSGQIKIKVSDLSLWNFNWRIIVQLVSMAGTGYYYMMSRNRLKPKLEFMKYDPI
ncbi:unnamed protein product, partial [Pocillopora meandrina]